MDDDTPGYADALAELDAILRELEGSDVDVDRLADRVARASTLILLCREKISKRATPHRAGDRRPRRRRPHRLMPPRDGDGRSAYAGRRTRREWPVASATMPRSAPPSLRAIAARVDARLDEVLTAERERWAALDPDLAHPVDEVRRLVLSGGKRLRPAFCHWGYVGAGGDATIRSTSMPERRSS